jgi:drug/metabolite transporter (DMT)-like permease
MLLSTIVLWALNLTVSRTILTNGFQPLSYAVVRYGLATAVFLGLTFVAERSFRILRSDLPLALAAAVALAVNQVCFVYAIELTNASTVALILGATPVFAALLGLAFRTEQPSSRFWTGAIVSFAGVGLVAVGAGRIVGGVGGILCGVATAATWAAYSVAVAPLMRRYSPARISAIVLAFAWIPIALVGAPQVAGQEWDVGWEIWALLVFATLGPLVVTNLLWFRALHRIGPARATLAANLQPFVAAVFAVALLAERMTALQVVGGVLIAGGILLARRRRPPRQPGPE